MPIRVFYVLSPIFLISYKIPQNLYSIDAIITYRKTYTPESTNKASNRIFTS